jgi:hypothetical protein
MTWQWKWGGVFAKCKAWEALWAKNLKLSCCGSVLDVPCETEMGMVGKDGGVALTRQWWCVHKPKVGRRVGGQNPKTKLMWLGYWCTVQN